ncbi:flavin-containing monooxygenase [Microbulbifer sp. EKSA008]|uniref:flavin-containing monooxygenase n=1 Tax=unclassified Microbulbifer TaxID=2619833 RepID=UPI001267AA28|nr:MULTISPECIES: NAD(P)/FAD-dependent oxidoreductase [unclassified Microbulbifer]QFT55929.1 putative oxidoreductase CzcO [Microbulbifer sp. THAF38]WHI48238.1 NAD(P)/FAD-dependent oxidoreductase [Microbulbifer sp. VAAF005]
MSRLDCIVIGGGQFGLHTARMLQQADLNYLLLERDSIGDVWRNRLEGMKLFTSRQFCALPGLAFPGDPEGFPTTVEIADYLVSYAGHFDLQVREGCEVVGLDRLSNGSFQVDLADGTSLLATSIVNATGANQIPQVPAISSQLAGEVQQLDGSLASTDVISDGHTVAVIGDGATGRQIVDRLAGRCNVFLATGSPRGLPPNRLFGRDIFWWLDRLRILSADKNSLIAKILKKRNPVPCGEYNNRRLKAKGVKIVGRALECSGRQIRFDSVGWHDIDTVIWATGYCDRTSWLKLPHCVDERGFIENYGRTPEPGLFLVGRKWLSCRASELVMGVEKDVERVMVPLRAFLSERKEIP